MGCIPTTKRIQVALQGNQEGEEPKKLDDLNENKNKNININNVNLIQISSTKIPTEVQNQNRDSKIIVLKPMPKHPTDSENKRINSSNSQKNILHISSIKKYDMDQKITSKYLNKRKVNSSMVILKNLEANIDDNMLVHPFQSGKQQSKIAIIAEPSLFDKMLPIWIEQSQEILVKIKGEWGIKEKGKCSYEGYNGLLGEYNLCSLLYRVGTSNKYQNFSKEEHKQFFSIKSEEAGPLFLKMNINKDLLINNKFSLFGLLKIELFNISACQQIEIFQKMGWDKDYLNNMKDKKKYEGFSFEEVELINYINLLRAKPFLYIDYFLGGNSELKNQLFSLYSVHSFLSPNKDYKILLENEEIRKKIFESASQKIIYEELCVNVYTNRELEIIEKILISGNFHWIFEETFGQIAVHIQKKITDVSTSEELYSCKIFVTSL